MRFLRIWKNKMARISSDNISSFLGGINTYLGTGAGKNFIDGIIGGKTKSFDEAMSAAEDLKRLITTYAQSEFTLSQFSIYQHIHNMDVGDPVRLGNGRYRIDLNLYGNLFRPSLLGGGGVDDIVSLFVHGWEDTNGKRKNVFGLWRNKMVKARERKDPMGFLEDAVNTFNIKYGSAGIIAEIGDDYK